MSRIVFVPLENPAHLASFDEGDADYVIGLESGQFTALFPGHYWQRRLYVIGSRFVEGVSTTGPKHPEHAKREVPFVEVSDRDALVLCARHGISPPDAVIASVANRPAEAADPTTDPSTTPGTSAGTARDAKGTPGLLPDELTGTMKDILTGAFVLGALDRSSCQPFGEIVKKAGLSSPHSGNVRKAYQRLSVDGLMQAKRGTNGGRWITEKGRLFICGTDKPSNLSGKPTD
jgi:hypothetical protein